MEKPDIALQMAKATDAIRGESRWLKEQAARVAEAMDAAHPVMSAAWKRIRELEADLKNIATQKTTEELIAEGGMAYEDADFEGAYDALIHIARRSIQPQT
jgi:uncharacterized coiled-coil DUF342 family protein